MAKKKKEEARITKEPQNNRLNTMDAVRLALTSGSSVCLRGETGVGKTDMIRQIAEKTGRKLIVIDAAIQSTEDLIGYPYRENDVMKWARPEWFPIADGDTKFIVFVDELNRASKEVINSLMPLLLDGKLHTHTLPTDTWVACAVNPDTDRYDSVSAFEDSAIWARLCIINVTPDSDSWQDWLKDVGIYNEQNKDLIKRCSDMLTYDKNALFVTQYPNNRSFTKILSVLNVAIEAKGTEGEFSTDSIEKTCIGIVGSNAWIQLEQKIMSAYDNSIKRSIASLLKIPITEDNIFSIFDSIGDTLKDVNNTITVEDMKGVLELMKTNKTQYKDQVDELIKVVAGLLESGKKPEFLLDIDVINAFNELNT